MPTPTKRPAAAVASPRPTPAKRPAAASPRSTPVKHSAAAVASPQCSAAAAASSSAVAAAASAAAPSAAVAASPTPAAAKAATPQERPVAGSGGLMPSVLFRMGGGMWLQTVLEPLSYDTLMEMTTACVDYDTILILKRINGWYVTAVMRNGEAVACLVDSALSACLVSLRVQRDSELRRFPCVPRQAECGVGPWRERHEEVHVRGLHLQGCLAPRRR